MMNHQSVSGCAPGCTCKRCCPPKCLSWSAVLVGALVGVGLSFLLNLFSIAIGLTTFTTVQEGGYAFAVGGFLGLAIGVIAAMFVAGWTAGYLAKPYSMGRQIGCLYGFVTWCLALVLTIILSTPVTKFVSSYSGAITNHNINIVRVVNHTAMAAATNSDSAVSQADEEKANYIGKVGLAMFALFFLGAFACCIGGHCGMTCQKMGCCPTKKEDECCPTKEKPMP